jgi:hypothetical protein
MNMNKIIKMHQKQVRKFAREAERLRDSGFPHSARKSVNIALRHQREITRILDLHQ